MKNFYLGLLFTVLLSNGFCQKQKIDSLKKKLSTPSQDTSELKTTIILGWQFFIVTAYDSTLFYEKKALELADKLIPKAKDKVLFALRKYKGRAFINIANVYYMRGDYSNSLKNYYHSLDISEVINFKLGMSKAHIGLGNVYTRLGNVPDALKHLFFALKIQEETGDKVGIGMSYNNIGIIYYDQNNYPEALTNYKKALDISKQLEDQAGIGRAYANIGVVYEKQKNYPEALKNHLASLQISEQLGDKFGIATAYNNIGMINGLQGNEREALKYHFLSKKIKEEIGDKRGLATSYINIGTAYMKLGKTNSVLPYLNKGLALSISIANKELIKSAYLSLSVAYEKQKVFEKAHENYKQYIIYRDSVINDENKVKMIQTQMNFDFEQKEIKSKAEQDKKEFEQSEKLKRQKLINWSIISLLGLVLLSSFLLFNRIRLKQKNKHQLLINEKQKELAVAVMDTQEQERKRIAEDLHDSLGHLLSTVKLNLQTPPESQKQELQNSINLLNQASEELQNITFNLMPRTLEEEGLVPALNELATKVSNSGFVKVHVHVHDMSRFNLEKQSQFNVYRIVQEAVNNILKHAEAKEITIQLIGLDTHFTIMIEDDGKGFDTETKKNGRGLKNIVTRSLWLKGNINIDSTPGRGTTITTEIPV